MIPHHSSCTAASQRFKSAQEAIGTHPASFYRKRTGLCSPSGGACWLSGCASPGPRKRRGLAAGRPQKGRGLAEWRVRSSRAYPEAQLQPPCQSRVTPPSPPLLPQSVMPKHEFFVDMSCEGCSNAVTRVLNKLGGVEFEIDLPNKKVSIESEHNMDTLLETLKKTGKEVSYVGPK
ncbi:copper transport protein ATOX1 [Dasypus novemcinctus]|uniref:copper transport protein ATOX1 n=1 Tax=Dasypus novemcinctus TaxID=9361 RepID=UPI00265F44AE|nr:copper transport protein ATOX1 [Dasypus novemcinctus]